MEKFNLEEYLKNPSRKVVTRDGRKARILCTDRKGDYPIIALVENCDSIDESVCSYDKNGIFYTSGISDNNDLFFAPETHEGWINVYRYSDGGHAYAGLYTIPKKMLKSVK